ncbi:hypothetical protein [Sinorhizobium fredii]|uniref:hypothetical protein n=1 Tax=Rhizobium fredii TaxID=380 RepID=UPI0004B80B42|nr:hypothetical protein [Sinorhizobium fredii]AWI58996.1 hypothetical protein AB395_00003360 [Sinorhizobium fredii CCBAU 45436]
MTCNHPDNPAVTSAAKWLADQNPRPKPIIPELRKRFDISALEACEAAALAEKYRMLRRAFG